jgi:transposase
MEACGSAHHWGRWLLSLGIEVRLQPPRYVRPYVKRNQTDAADAAALLEALHRADIARLETQRSTAARESHSCTTLLSVPGIGLLTATAMVAATGGSVAHFQSARHFAAWFGLTPKESCSGNTRHLGRISKRGDRYLKMLLTHGARSVLRAAHVAQSAGCSVDGLRQWALANKLARICYAALRDQEPYARAPQSKDHPAGLRPASLNTSFPPPLARRLSAHHGQPGSPHTARRR